MVWPMLGLLHACQLCQQQAERLSYRNRTSPPLPTLTKSYSTFPDLSQAPAIFTPLHRVVREQEAVTLNDSMNRPGPFRACVFAVSCFDMSPNTSLALGQRVWVQSCVHEEENCSLAAHSLQSGAFLVLFCLAERERLWHVADTGLLISPRPTCLSAS